MSDIKPLTTDAASIEDEFHSNTSVVTSVASTMTSTTLLSANPDRKGFVLVNDSEQDCFVKFGTTASTASYTIKMAGFTTGTPATYENLSPTYRGRIDAIWSSINGSMKITEHT